MRRLVVFGWHNVAPSWCFPYASGAGIAGLERQVRLLQRCCSIVPLADALQALRDGGPLPPRPVAVTFDDGYRDNLELAVPVLERLGAPATFFLVPELLDAAVEPWWEVAAWAFTRATQPALDWEGAHFELDGAAARRRAFDTVAGALKRRDATSRARAVALLVSALEPTGDWTERADFMGWDGARELVARGFEVGSHSMRHAILSEEADEEQNKDLAESRERLRAGTGADVDVLAYPNGQPHDYTAATIAAARDAGFSFAVTTRDGFNTRDTPPFELRRFVTYPERGRVDFLGIAKWRLRSLLARH